MEKPKKLTDKEILKLILKQGSAVGKWINENIPEHRKCCALAPLIMEIIVASQMKRHQALGALAEVTTKISIPPVNTNDIVAEVLTHIKMIALPPKKLKEETGNPTASASQRKQRN